MRASSDAPRQVRDGALPFADIVAGPLLTKTEAKHATNKRQPKGKDDAAAKKAAAAADGAKQEKQEAKAGEAGDTATNGSATEGGDGAAAVVGGEGKAGEPTDATAATTDQKSAKEEPSKGDGEKDNRKRARSRSPGRQRKRGRGPPRASAVAAAAKISFATRFCLLPSFVPPLSHYILCRIFGALFLDRRVYIPPIVR